MSIKEQMVLDKNGTAVAVQILLNRYKKLLELAEKMEDIKAYDRAAKRKHHFVPFSQAVNEVKVTHKASKVV